MTFSWRRYDYDINVDFFNKWTSQMAYILGFIFADGNIHGRTLAFDLQKRDRQLLNDINKTMHSTYPIRLRKMRYVRLRISNSIIISKIMSYGVIQNKSSISK